MNCAKLNAVTERFKLMLFNYFVCEFEADGMALKMIFLLDDVFKLLLYFQNKGDFFLYLQLSTILCWV